MSDGGHRKREKRVLLTLEEDAAVAKVVQELGAALGVELTFSDFARTALFLLDDIFPRLSRHLPEANDLSRPPTRYPDRVVEFERRIREILVKALENGGFTDPDSTNDKSRSFAERFSKRLEREGA